MLGSHIIARSLISMGAAIALAADSLNHFAATSSRVADNMDSNLNNFGYRRSRWGASYYSKHNPAGTKLARRAAKGTVGIARLR